MAEGPLPTGWQDQVSAEVRTAEGVRKAAQDMGEQAADASKRKDEIDSAMEQGNIDADVRRRSTSKQD